jgi:hypothetical protein
MHDHGQLVALGVLTRDPNSGLNTRMAESFALAPSHAVVIRLVLFTDEALPEPAAAAGPTQSTPGSFRVVALERPMLVSRRPQYQCVAKIIAWLRHASRHHPNLPFYGWVDSDTWFLPSRLETFLESVLHIPGSNFSWIGHFMHWSRFDHVLLDGMGFQYASTPREEAAAMKLEHDHAENRKRLQPHQEDLQGGPVARRNLSFTMTQGSFTVFGHAALAVLLNWVTQADEAKRFLGLGPDSMRSLPAAKPSQPRCVLPTDVGLGWLATHAFAGRAEVRAVSMFQLFELFVWPSSRYNVNHSVVVHLPNAKGGSASSVLDFYDAFAARKTLPLLRPRFWCERSGWLHSLTTRWAVCVNVAQCDGWASSRWWNSSSRSKAVPRTVGEGWVPGGARDVCATRKSSDLW